MEFFKSWKVLHISEKVIKQKRQNKKKTIASFLLLLKTVNLFMKVVCIVPIKKKTKKN